MARRTPGSQDSLPFGEAELEAVAPEESSAEDGEEGRRRAGRPRVWASEAERKRAYRERLATDFAEPDRLRKELRSERKKVAEKDREIARLQRELDRSKAALSAASARQDELDRMIEALEMKVEDWRKRAGAPAKKREEERAERDAIDRRGATASNGKVRLELPNLRTKGHPPAGPRVPRQ